MRKEKFSKTLLVEGKDDQHVIWALCEKFTISETFDVVEYEGVENIIESLAEEIPVRFKSNIETVGIVIDADKSLKNRWESLKNILKKQEFFPPDEFPESGLILQTGKRKIGVWIMPNNRLDGILEDFLAFLVPNDDKLLPIALSTIGSIENQTLQKYPPTHSSKALIHTWLAWQKDPGTPLGQSITKRYLTTSEETCRLFVEWINRLFN